MIQGFDFYFKSLTFIDFLVDFINQNILKQLFLILTIHKSFLGLCEVPQKIGARLVYPFDVYWLQTIRQGKSIFRLIIRTGFKICVRSVESGELFGFSGWKKGFILSHGTV